MKFTTAFIASMMAFGALWVQLGFPVPASAEDIRTLSKEQAKIGIRVQLQTESSLRREIFQLKWELRRVTEAKNPTADTLALKRTLEAQIVELEFKETEEQKLRARYKRQLQAANQ